jgi:two-component system sensor histidine kinase PilS (NtrC family)
MPRDRQQSAQIVWLMSLRVVIVTTLLLSALLVQAITDRIFSELNPIYYLVGFTYLLTLVYAGVHAAGRWRRWFLHVQLVGDLLIITGLIYYSGGIDSAFPFLYILTIITASIVLMRRGALLVALTACVLYGTLAALIFNRFIPPPTGFLASPFTLTVNQVYYNLFVRWIGFVAASLLSSYLAEKLRETGETLEERSADLEKLQVFYEDIINSVNSGMLSTDLDGRVGSLNHAGERILERSFGALRGRPVAEVLALTPAAARRIAEMGPEGCKIEQSYPGSNGPKHLGLSASNLFDRENLHRGYIYVFQDLTLLKQLEDELRLKDRMAAIGRMAAGIAHEIRNPLASISGSVQMLRADVPLDEEQRVLMDIVLKESERLNRIIEEFLFYAKPAPPLPQPVDLEALVEETVILFRNSTELLKEHVLEWSRDAGNLTVTADPNHLRQVLWNLLRNAVQAMPAGGRLHVRVGPADRDGVAFTVEDEGLGIREEDPESLWQPFHPSRTKGTGLGLAIVYRIVRDHGGRVALANRDPVGARIHVWLPRVGPATESEAALPRLEESRVAP